MGTAQTVSVLLFSRREEDCERPGSYDRGDKGGNGSHGQSRLRRIRLDRQLSEEIEELRLLSL